MSAAHTEHGGQAGIGIEAWWERLRRGTFDLDARERDAADTKLLLLLLEIGQLLLRGGRAHIPYAHARARVRQARAGGGVRVVRSTR